MKSSKKWLLIAVLAVAAITMAGQRSFAEVLYNGTGLTNLFGSLGFNSLGMADQIVDHSGVFDAKTRIFQISGDPAWFLGSNRLTIFGNDSNSPLYGPSLTGNPSASNDLTGREILFENPGLESLYLSMSNALGTFNPKDPSQNSSTAGATRIIDYYNHFILFELTAAQLASFSFDSNVITTNATAYLVGFEEDYLGTNQYPPGEFRYGDYNSGVFLVITRWDDPTTASDVPEPATMILWTLGGLSLAGASWRRNRNKKKLLA